MSQIIEEIKNLPPEEKARIFHLLQDDKDLEEYMISDKVLFDELKKRDNAFERGEIRLTTRQELSQRLKRRRK